MIDGNGSIQSINYALNSLIRLPILGPHRNVLLREQDLIHQLHMRWIEYVQKAGKVWLRYHQSSPRSVEAIEFLHKCSSLQSLLALEAVFRIMSSFLRIPSQERPALGPSVANNPTDEQTAGDSTEWR